MIGRYGRLLAALLTGATAACSPREAADKSNRTQRAPSTASVDSTNSWAVTPFGLGPLHAGMSRSEAEAAVGGSLAVAGDTGWTNCAYTPTDRLPRGTRVMVEGGSVARVEVDSGSAVPTAEGARVGDSEKRIRDLYGNRVTLSPHKYTDGHYLTVRSAAPSESSYRVVFETDGKRVLRFRAGRTPPVEYVEGCG